MRIAVTGATGFIGWHLVNRLLAAGHEVVALVHTNSGEGTAGKGVTRAAGSVEDVPSLEAAFNGVAAVYHLVGLIAESKVATFEQTVVRGTENVVVACQATGVSRIIFLSAMGAAADAPSQYHRTKHRAEQVILSSDLEGVILRSSVVYGPGDRFMSRLAKLITRLPLTPVIGNGKYRLQPIFIRDLTEIMYRALTTDEAVGRVVDVGGPEQLEYLEILDILKSVLGRKRLNFFFPTAFMSLIMRIMEMVIKPAPLTRDQLVMMEMGNTGDVREMVKLFGVKPVSFAQGLRSYMRK